ncbi:hypothetical protein DZF45_24980 [Salmonella enterica]|nr:hypothetical protein [Salmonella enterica]
MLFRPFGPGRPRFSVVGRGCDGSGVHGSGLSVNILDVVTICTVGARRRATGGASGVSGPART